MSPDRDQDPDTTPEPEKRITRLTVAIERPDGTILREDCITQADQESDGDFLARGAIILEYLRHRTPASPRRSST